MVGEPNTVDLEAKEDEALVLRAQAGDPRAFDELVLKHNKRLYALIYHMTQNREDTYDLFEECYSGVLNKSDTMPQIIEKHGLDVSKCCYIGDMVHDIRTAHSVEMSSIAVLSGYDSVERLAKEQPTLIVENVPHLHKVVSYFM